MNRIEGGCSSPDMDFPLKEEPCVSVVIPVYNREKYLKECLDSVISQTYRNLEIICVDDGSTDKSPEILADYALADNRIRVIRQENSGPSAGRNRGIDAAQGKYLYFIDSDDYILPGHFEKLICLMEQDNLDVCLFNIHPFISPDADSEQFREIYERFEKYYKRSHDYVGVRTGAELMKMMCEANEYLVHVCAYITRTKYVKESGIRFLNGILHEDNLYTFRIMLDADRASFFPDVLYQRRLAAGSIMTSDTTFCNVEGIFKCFLGMYRYMETMAPDMEKEQVAVTAATRLLNNVRFKYASLKEPEEKEKYENLSPQERMMFYALVIANEKLQDDNKKLSDDNKKLSSDNKKLGNDNKKLSDEKSELRSEKDRLKKKSEELDKNKKELEKKKTDLETQNNELQKKKTELETKNSELEKKKTDLETRNNELQKKKTDLETQNNELKEKRSALETQKKELEKNKKNLEEENKNLKRDLNNIRSTFLYRVLHKIKLM